MNTTNTTTQIGPGFLGCLAILFIALKLTGYIAWSWLWVLSPLWLPIAAFLGVLLLWLVIALVCDAVRSIVAWHRSRRARP